ARPAMIVTNSCSNERARCVPQDVLLKCDDDPPVRVGGKLDALIGIEPADRAHQSQLTLARQIVPRQAGAAIDLRQLKDDMPVAFGELESARNIVAFSPATAQRLIRRVCKVVPACAARRWPSPGKGSIEVHSRAPFSPVALPGLRITPAH